MWDPWCDPAEAKTEYGLDLITEPEHGAFDAIIVAVAHDLFGTLGIERVRGFGKPEHVLFDIKHLFPAGQVDGPL